MDDEEGIRAWLAEWQRLINAGDRAAARALFAPGVVGYGTLEAAVFGIEALAERQWGQVWPRIAEFAFDAPDMLAASDGLAVLALRWQSRGRAADGTDFARAGRATLALRRQGRAWRCIHSHLSMNPGTAALR